MGYALDTSPAMVHMLANALRDPVVREESIAMAAAMLDELADEKIRTIAGITPQTLDIVRVRIRAMWGTAKRPTGGWPSDAEMKDLLAVLTRMLSSQPRPPGEQQVAA